MNNSLQRGLIIVLVTITGAIHLVLGINGVLNGSLDMVMFVLNGLGFFGLLAAMFMKNIPFFESRRKLATILMISFAAITFILFFVVNGFLYWNVAAVFSKAAELLLIIIGFVYLRQL